MQKFLSFIERTGNRLPHPAILFFLLALVVVFLSALLSAMNLSAIHPATGKEVLIFNLFSLVGIHKISTSMVTNFTGFAPLGTVLVALLGIGIAEGSGFISAVLRVTVLSTPKKLLTMAVVFTGVISNTASEVGYVVLVPLSGMLFLAVGRHPIAGIAAAFAGVSGGYSANIFLGTIDPLLSGLSQEAAQIIDKSYIVSAACNYYFMAASTVLITLIGTIVTEKILVPKLGEYHGKEARELQIEYITENEKRGLFFALLGFVFLSLVLVLSALPISGGVFDHIFLSGFLRDPQTGSLLHSPFMSGIVGIIFISAALLGIFYGIGAKTIKSGTDIINGMSKSMSTLGSYIVLVFFAAQFVAYFNWSNLGLIIAINGAAFLKQLAVGPVFILIGLIFIAAIINLFIGSASAKWAIMAPVFVPMFMLLGISPETTQLAYRIGDSVTNIITPMMSYFALIVAFLEKYDKKAGIGTIVATMLPYSISFLLSWTIFFIIWFYLGLPIGPGANILLR